MKQAQFITLMSESLGVEEKTIRMIVRNLREAGFFTTGARGVNAPDIQPIDAVRVVISVVASSSPGRAVRDVKYFGSLKPDCRDGTRDDASHVGLDRDKTLEDTLLDCLSNRFRYDQIIGGFVRLSENGDAFLSLADGWQHYHQREQWQAVKKEYSGANDNPKDKAVLEDWEAMRRIANTKVNRSAEFSLEDLHQIGFEIIGWEVD